MIQGAVKLQDGATRIACDIESAPAALLSLAADDEEDAPVHDFHDIFNQPRCFMYRHRVQRTSYCGRVTSLLAMHAHSFDVLQQVHVDLHGRDAHRTVWELLVDTTPIANMQGSGTMLLQLFPMLMVRSDVKLRFLNATPDARVTVRVVGLWLPDNERIPLFHVMEDANLVQRVGESVRLTVRNGVTTVQT